MGLDRQKPPGNRFAGALLVCVDAVGLRIRRAKLAAF
jgi:hypothetical protein